MNKHVIVVFDEVSRLRVNINLTDLIYKDIKIVASLSDLNEDVLLAEGCVVILMDGYFVQENNYAAAILMKEMYDIEFIYLGTDTLWLEVASTFCKSYKIDANSLNSELVSSIVYEDVNFLNKLQATFKPFEEGKERANKILLSKSETDNAKNLARQYLALNEIAHNLTRFKTDMMKLYGDLSAGYKFMQDENRELYNNYVALVKESIRVNGVLKQYEVALQRDFYDKVDISKYKSRPVVVYLKEYEELVFFQSFLDTLWSTVYFQNKMPVKILLLADSSFSRRLLKLPSKFHVIHDSYNKGEIAENDYLVKIGNYDKVLDILLTNDIRLGVLIVVDCKDNTDTVLSGSYIKFNLCRNLARCDMYSIEPDNTICNNNKEHELSWDYYPEYSKLTEDEDRFLFLSSTSVIQYIYRVIEMYRDSV